MSSQTGSFIDRSSSAINESTATTVAAENKGRQYLLIQNLDSAAMYVNFGGTAVAAAAGNVYLAANGGYIEFQGETFVPSTSISIISASGAGSSNVVTVLEG